MRADEIKSRVTCLQVLNHLAVNVPAGDKAAILCPVHDDKKDPSATYYRQTDSWACHKCGIGGTAIDLVMHTQKLTFKDACKWIEDKFNLVDLSISGAGNIETNWKKVDTYCYKDEYGKPVFYVDRMESDNKKRFIQYQLVDGKRINNVDGIRKVLLNLQNIIKSEDVYVFEGEKKVKCLVKMDASYPATCNAGGSNGWLSAYGESLKDKQITICPDGDEAGEKWLNAVMDSVREKCKSMRVVRMPKGFNDIADLFDALGDELAEKKFMDLCGEIPFVCRGGDLPIYSAAEMMAIYKREVTAVHPVKLDLGFWLPTLRHHVRPLVPGDVITVMGDTGMGKTAVLQNIAVSAKDLTVLFFEIELSEMVTAERYAALTHQVDAWHIEGHTRQGSNYHTDKWNHIWTCPLSKMDVEYIETLINKAELKIGKRPDVVMIDYIGLLKGGSGKRYERLSTIAEEIRVIAKSTKTIIFIASQIHRKEDDDVMVSLHDAKDSGSIECSSSLVLGAWKTDRETMVIKVLKNTRGNGGDMVTCDYDGPKYLIKERPQVYTTQNNEND
jgi:hypothetical protein